MQKYKCLIVDDERLAQELLQNYAQKIPYLEVVGTCSTAIEAMQYLQQNQVDILFLDIQMPDLTGLELLKSLRNQPATIFTTAYSEYALDGFELGVIDYLLKPIEFDRFFKAVSKVISSFSKTVTPLTAAIAEPQKQQTPPYFFVKSDGQLVKIAFADILFIEALQKYIRIHTAKERIVTLLSLSKIIEELPAINFIRIHRSYIVNIDQIERIEGNMVRMQKHQLPISKGQRDRFFTMIQERGIFE